MRMGSVVFGLGLNSSLLRCTPRHLDPGTLVDDESSSSPLLMSSSESVILSLDFNLIVDCFVFCGDLDKN